MGDYDLWSSCRPLWLLKRKLRLWRIVLVHILGLKSLQYKYAIEEVEQLKANLSWGTLRLRELERKIGHE